MSGKSRWTMQILLINVFTSQRGLTCVSDVLHDCESEMASVNPIYVTLGKVMHFDICGGLVGFMKLPQLGSNEKFCNGIVFWFSVLTI